MTTAQDGGKAVSLTHRPHLLQEMLLVLISVRGRIDPRAIVRSEGFYANDTRWDRTSDLPICSTAPYHCATVVPPLHISFVYYKRWVRRGGV